MSFDFDFITPYNEEEFNSRLARIKHVALDMDGTIYMGKSLFDYTKPSLRRLNELGIGYSFLTNNPSRSVDDYVRKLSLMGIETEPSQLYTSSIATIDYIRTNHPQINRLFVLGTPSMIGEFERAGFEMTSDNAIDTPDAVVVGFDMSLTYSRLCRATWWASKGLPYFATNPDRVCPTDQPVVLVDCGSICKAIEWATGRIPDVVLGKPDKNMLKGITDRYSLRPEEVAMIGDRIYTDIEMARNAGAFGVLVLSGETTLETVRTSHNLPDVTLPDIGAFTRLIESVH